MSSLLIKPIVQHHRSRVSPAQLRDFPLHLWGNLTVKDPTQQSDSRSGCCSLGNSRGGEDPGLGQPAQHRQKSLRGDFKAFGALHGSTPTDRRTFGVDRLVWTAAARKEEGVPWYTGVLLGAERFMASWHKSQEEASRLREVNLAAKALLANQKTKTKKSKERKRGGGERGEVGEK